MAYKKDVNDIRESPSIKIYKKLTNYNNLIDFHDDKVKQVKLNKIIFLNLLIIVLNMIM